MGLEMGHHDSDQRSDQSYPPLCMTSFMNGPLANTFVQLTTQFCPCWLCISFYLQRGTSWYRMTESSHPPLSEFFCKIFPIHTSNICFMLPNFTDKSSNLIAQSLMLKVWRMIKQHGLISLSLHQSRLLFNCQTYFYIFRAYLGRPGFQSACCDQNQTFISHNQF